MRKGLLGVALGLILIAGPAIADVLAVPESESAPTAASRPAKGISMADVEKQFGEPSAKRPTVGGDTPKHPPITRWDYPGFAVIFEHDKVVDTVVPGAPPRIHHTEQLEGDAASYTAPPAAETPEPVPPVADPALMPAPGPDAVPPAAEPGAVTPEAPAEPAPEQPTETPAP